MVSFDFNIDASTFQIEYSTLFFFFFFFYFAVLDLDAVSMNLRQLLSLKIADISIFNDIVVRLQFFLFTKWK